ncbi:hypothetical protein [Desulfobulbus elongatus]|uniref:hypothetical protein n=1 Tax=Desulfobulbus elongatus TaxID=53332 RepID=UPI00047F808B|nr:hypothetical protein [Desulfobulbus elongatus]
MQLDLFQWDLLETGKGYACLAQLDLAEARSRFARVLEARPAHPAATAGLQAVRYWEQAFRAVAALQGERAVALFWKRLQAFSFGSGEVDRELRASLLARLQQMMAEEGIDYLPPDLCLGYLSLQLGDAIAAESQLRTLIETVPGEGLLYGYLGDALWRQGRREIANGVYTIGLLRDPERLSAHVPCNARLAAVIAAYGAAMAPVHGFLEGILPLVELEESSATEAVRIYGLLRRSERARRRRDHAAMMAARRELQNLAPEVFTAYLRFVQAGEQEQPPREGTKESGRSRPKDERATHDREAGLVRGR